MSKIKSFTDLVAWRNAHGLVLDIYKLTACFPPEEIYALISQMRRSVVSVTSNIAEGFSRRTAKEKMQFYFIAIGSLTELQNQLLIAKDLNYLTQNDFKRLAQLTIMINKLINGLIKSSQSYT